MAKLPGNLVKAPAFDSPIRRTEPAGLTLVADGGALGAGESARPEPPAVLTSVAPLPETSGSAVEEMPSGAAEDAVVDGLIHRLTMRFTDDQWKALQAHCHESRMRGVKTNPAELMRAIVDEWASRRT